VKVKTFLLSLSVISYLLMSCASYATKLRLVIPQFPPYTSEENRSFSGIGIKLVDQVMQDIGVNYKLRAVPNYARALEEVRRGQADGFFLASENEQRNTVAVMSEPLLMNRWSWFFSPNKKLNLSSSAFKSAAKVATIHGSNTNKWLIKNNYNITTKPNSASSFPMLLLEKKRIDAVFLSSAVFHQVLKAQGYSTKDYVEVIQKSKPFGLYISKAYLERNPYFMKKLNTAIIKRQDLN